MDDPNARFAIKLVMMFYLIGMVGSLYDAIAKGSAISLAYFLGTYVWAWIVCRWFYLKCQDET